MATWINISGNLCLDKQSWMIKMPMIIVRICEGGKDEAVLCLDCTTKVCKNCTSQGRPPHVRIVMPSPLKTHQVLFAAIVLKMDNRKKMIHEVIFLISLNL